MGRVKELDPNLLLGKVTVAGSYRPNGEKRPTNHTTIGFTTLKAMLEGIRTTTPQRKEIDLWGDGTQVVFKLTANDPGKGITVEVIRPEDQSKISFRETPQGALWLRLPNRPQKSFGNNSQREEAGDILAQWVKGIVDADRLLTFPASQLGINRIR